MRQRSKTEHEEATMSAIKRPYSDAFLTTYSRTHLFYELDMLVWSARLCASHPALIGPTAEDGLRIGNSLIEAFVVHLRNATDFFFPTRCESTDVVAADYCAEGAWQAVLPPPLETARRRAHKRLAHLTSDRTDGEGWDFLGLLGELTPVMQTFVSKAESSRLAPNIARLVF